jgi:hypothetical protein
VCVGDSVRDMTLVHDRGREGRAANRAGEVQACLRKTLRALILQRIARGTQQRAGTLLAGMGQGAAGAVGLAVIKAAKHAGEAAVCVGGAGMSAHETVCCHHASV